jgi:hypothetical protein
MRKNKKTVMLTRVELTPLTKRILAQMGPEGQDIQNRLKKFRQNLTSAHLKTVEKANRFGYER